MKVTRESRRQKLLRYAKGASVLDASRNLITYSVGEYQVQFDIRNIQNPWSCTCVHGSLYRAGKDELCVHIEAVKHRIKQEGKITW